MSNPLIEDLVVANRILADQGVVDGYGHVSVRLDRDPGRYLLARSLAPELVTAADIMEFDLDSRPVDGRGGQRTCYMEINAKLQMQAMALPGSLMYLDPEEVRKVEARQDYARSWDLWKRKAPAT